MAISPAGRGPELSTVVGFFLALSTITIALRAYCRAHIVKCFGGDDWLAIVAYAFFVFFCGFAITGVYHGTGQHAADIKPPTEIPIGLKWWWACEPVYVLSNMALKASIALMLLRLTVRQSHKILIWIVLGVTELYSAFFFFLFVLQCRPSSYFWTQYTGGSGTCIDPTITVNATYAYSAVSCLGDWIFAIFPMCLVWNLQMNPRTKISVALILSLGAIASAATIVRIPYVQTLADKNDFLYATTDVAIWSTCETGLGICACSIATLKPLFRVFLSRSRLLGGSSTGANGGVSGARPAWRTPTTGGKGGLSSSRGYIRSTSHDTREEYGLRNDIGGGGGGSGGYQKNGTVTTIIGRGDLEAGGRDMVDGGKYRKGGGRERSNSLWSVNESKLTIDGGSADDEVGLTGAVIRKTTVSRQTVQ